jgi:serine/threonine-protein kinase
VEGTQASRSEADPLIGSVVDGDFEVVKPVGAGSHATVYQARQRSVGGRTVALKVLSRPYLQLPEADVKRAAKALQKEGELLGQMQSACFVDVYRAGALSDGRPYLALEFAHGLTLGQWMQTRRQQVAEVLDVLVQWAEGLAELHARGWVHRDVTPNNAVVAMTLVQTPRLLTYDLGTATQTTAGRPDRFKQGWERERPPGTAAYLSPEQASGGVVDGRADQFALAAIAYEAFSGVRPFARQAMGLQATLDVLRGDSRLPEQPLAVVAPHVPAGVTHAINRALDRDPDKRFVDVQAFARALVERAQAEAPTPPLRQGMWQRLFGGKP